MFMLTVAIDLRDRREHFLMSGFDWGLGFFSMEFEVWVLEKLGHGRMLGWTDCLEVTVWRPVVIAVMGG